MDFLFPISSFHQFCSLTFPQNKYQKRHKETGCSQFPQSIIIQSPQPDSSKYTKMKNCPIPSLFLSHIHVMLDRQASPVKEEEGVGQMRKAAALWLRLSESGIAVISVFRCNRSPLPSGVNNNKHKYNRQTRPAGHVCTHTQMQACTNRKDYASDS